LFLFFRINDVSDFQETLEAMSMLGFSSVEQDAILSLVSSVLHIGNIQFTSTGDRNCELSSNSISSSSINAASNLMQVH
jgi:myosin-1